MIAMVPVTDIRLFDARDTPWIAQLLELVRQTVGEPWRVLLERVDQAPLFVNNRPVPPRARQAMLAALRRVLGGRTERRNIARKLRERVLGHPALDPAAREARIATVAAELGIEAPDVERMLWADLARERPVTLPGGPPDPRLLAAHANIDRLQREMRRAHAIDIHVTANAHALVRMAARCGLITHVGRDEAGFVLSITGPLALFHATTIYGRALGALVPLLAEHDDDLSLDIHCEFRSGPRTLRADAPILLPPVSRVPKPSIAEKLAAALEKRHIVTRDPPPISSGDRVLFPDMAVDIGRRVLVEVIGFSTEQYVTEKLDAYRAAGEPVVLCVDATRSKPAAPHPNVLGYERRIEVDTLLAKLSEAI